jgi:hypothetical protein
MKKLIAFLFTIHLSLFVFAQNKDLTQIIFDDSALEGFTRITPTNEQANLYDYIYQSNDKNTEVRYTFRSDTKEIKEGDPLKTFAYAMFLNTAKSNIPGNFDIKEHSEADVKADFMGSSGYFAFYEPSSSFGKGYSFCLAFLIHKANVGSFTIYLLAKNQTDYDNKNNVKTLGGNVIKFNDKISINPSLQKKYLPNEIQDLFIGMSLNKLKATRPKMALPKDAFGINYVENFSTGAIKTITCQLLDDSTVYEFTVEYRDEAKANSLAKEMYHEPNDPSSSLPQKWEFKLSDGLVLKCWVFRNKICIADSRQF